MTETFHDLTSILPLSIHCQFVWKLFSHWQHLSSYSGNPEKWAGLFPNLLRCIFYFYLNWKPVILVNLVNLVPTTQVCWKLESLIPAAAVEFRLGLFNCHIKSTFSVPVTVPWCFAKVLHAICSTRPPSRIPFLSDLPLLSSTSHTRTTKHCLTATEVPPMFVGWLYSFPLPFRRQCTEHRLSAERPFVVPWRGWGYLS